MESPEGTRRLSRRAAIMGAASSAVTATMGWKLIARADDDHHDWGYDEHNGPDHWPGECADGSSQSPIDLTGAGSADLADVVIEYPVQESFTIKNSGHSIEVRVDPGGASIFIDGKQFDLSQFHFHAPSEHTVDGRAYPMELHIVHGHGEELAVLGIFLDVGDDNETLAPVFDNMPDEEGDENPVDAELDIVTLVPQGSATYRYHGSLTMPSCDEVVTWTVYKDPLQVSQAQIDAFMAIYATNARPTQPLNERDLIEDPAD